jgi:hypothetical protein
MGAKRKTAGKRSAAAAAKRGRYAPEGGGTLRKGRKRFDDMVKAMTVGRRRIIASASAAVLLVLAAIAVFLALRSKPTVVLVLDADPAMAATLSTALADLTSQDGPRLAVQAAAPGDTFASVLAAKRVPDLVIGLAGRAFVDAAPSLASVPETAVRRSPSALRAAVTAAGERKALPLLVDHFELAYKMDAGSSPDAKAPRSWDGFLAAARSLAARGAPSIILAGGDDRTLLLFTGALLEASAGARALDGLVGTLSRRSDFRASLDAPLDGAVTLRNALDILVSLRTTGVLHPEWFRMKARDVEAFMKADRAPFVFMALSDHRAIPIQIVRSYASAPFPSLSGAARPLQAPVWIGAVPDRLPAERKAGALALLERLLSNPVQKRLGDATGLAPASSTAETLDMQASDVRLWVAASAGAYPGLDRDAFADPAAASSFAAELRAYVEAGGNGY